MEIQGLKVLDRPAKPRTVGVTWCIDDGAPVDWFRDIIRSYHRLIDGVKFGWGTALVTDHLDAKVAACQQYRVDYCFGGTLFEAYWLQHRLDAFFQLLETYRCPVVEISDGTVHLSAKDRRHVIRDFKAHLRVFTEVGSKNPEESRHWTAEDWVRRITEDRESGSDMVILEARESGTIGLYLPSGEIRTDVATGILASSLDPRWLMFEAPQKAQQVYWIHRIGPGVNLSNIPLNGSVNLETLRLGLRSDTLDLLSQPSSLFAQG
ncbi:MAG: phosphosulfolactate synthase [Firmicutes bacterium]|nr:phosphosulfolactate synthase [Bacillota bacterium]